MQRARANSVDDDLMRLRRIAGDEVALQELSGAVFHQAVCEGHRSLSVYDLIVARSALERQLGLAPVLAGAEDTGAGARLWMKRFDRDGDGTLNELEFLEACRWTILLRIEDLDPPLLRRGEFIGSAGAPYDLEKKLGEGAFGEVHLVVGRAGSSAAGSRRVMKTVNKRRAAQNGVLPAELQKEIDVLKLLDHPHVVRLFDFRKDANNVYLVMDLCGGGDLYDLVTKLAADKRQIPESWTARCFAQTLEAVAYCHSKGVMHRDIKLENVMLRDPVPLDFPAEAVHVMLVDVGLAELFGQQHGRAARSKEIAGSLPTMAPEMLQRKSGHKCDVYSVGCLLFAVLNPNGTWIKSGGADVLYRYPFFPSSSASDPGGMTSLLRSQRLGPPMQHLRASSAAAQHAVRQLLAFDERQRPSATECLRLPWLRDVAQAPGAPPCGRAQRLRVLMQDNRLRAWQRAAIMQVATQLPATRLAELEGPFRSMDLDGTGAITRKDLRRVLEDLGVAAQDSEDAAAAIMAHHDADRSGTIEWTEFVAAMIPASEELLSEALEMEFNMLDSNFNKTLERDEVRTLLERNRLQGLRPQRGENVELMLGDLFPGAGDRVTLSQFKEYFVERL